MTPSTGHSHPVVHPSTHGHLHVPGTSSLHRAAAAPKLVALFAFMVVVVVTPRRMWLALSVDAAAIIALLVIARAPLRTIAARLLVVMPVVLLAALLPILSGGRHTDLGPFSLSIAGLWAAWNLVIKTIIGVLSTILLTVTTPVAAVIEGLSQLPIPRLVISITSLMFRYLDLIDDRLTRMRQAMTARCYDPRWLWQTKPIAQSAGTLFVRTYERGERIHHAMLARGYTGVMPILHRKATPFRVWLGALIPSAIAGLSWVISARLIQ